jgi:hypothetical protein
MPRRRENFAQSSHALRLLLSHSLQRNTRLGDCPWRRATYDRRTGLHRRGNTSFRSVEKPRRRATPVITSSFENVLDKWACVEPDDRRISEIMGLSISRGRRLEDDAARCHLDLERVDVLTGKPSASRVVYERHDADVVDTVALVYEFRDRNVAAAGPHIEGAEEIPSGWQTNSACPVAGVAAALMR